jgi:hypothetical protein
MLFGFSLTRVDTPAMESDLSEEHAQIAAEIKLFPRY